MKPNNVEAKQEKSILVIGCGRMGGAIINGWLKTITEGISIYIVDPYLEKDKIGSTTLPIHTFTSSQNLPQEHTFDIVLLAIKPQMIKDSLPEYLPLFNQDTLVISIAAGTTCSTLAELIPGVQSIVRVMPNTPAFINQGVMVASSKNAISDSHKELCRSLFTPLGQFYWLSDEAQMDAVTAVSGSGPAYLFLFVESMIEAGIANGLPADIARNLAMHTVAGAANMVTADSRDVSDLRKEVTSPKGTTEAALNVFMENDAMIKLVSTAITAAADRSKELANMK